ncbi:hypothetical protein D3C87_1363460 [compost metagenome]
MIDKISAGEIEPSDKGIPALIKSLSCTKICFESGTRYFLIWPSRDSIEISRLPRLTPPKVTTPSISVTTAGLEGLRASNNSVTRGRPPVISRVLPVERGILTKIPPSFTVTPSATET